MELSTGCRLSSRLCDQPGFLPTPLSPRHPLFLNKLICCQGGKDICTLRLTFAPSGWSHNVSCYSDLFPCRAQGSSLFFGDLLRKQAHLPREITPPTHTPTQSIVIVEISSKTLLPKAQSLELGLSFSSYPMLN